MRSIGKNSLIFMLGIALSKLTSFLMLPVYTRYLTPADYGTLELLQITIDVVGMIAGMSIASAVFRFHADCRTDAEKMTLLSTAALGVIGLALISGSAGIAAAPFIKEVILPDAGRSLYFQLFFLVYILQAVETVPLLYLRAVDRSAAVVAIGLAKLVAMLSLNIYFVVFLRMEVLGVLVSNLLASSVVSTGLLVYFFSRTGIRFSPSCFGGIARYGYPLAAVSICNFFLVYSDRFFLNHYTSTADVGIYALAYKFAFLLSAIAFQPFMMAWGPQRFVIAKRPDAGEIFQRVFLYLNLMLGGFAFLTVLFVADVLGWMADPAFHPAARYVPLILTAQVIHHWTAYSNLGLQLRRSTLTFAWVSLLGVAFVLALNFILIPRFGVLGACWASVLAYTFRFMLIYEFSQRTFRIDYGWYNVGRLYAVLSAALIARWALGPLPLSLSLGVNCLFVLPVAMAVSRAVLTPRERDYLRARLLRPLALVPGAAPR